MEKMYAKKKEYVEKTLAGMLEPINEFGSIKYARNFITGEEFVKVTEANGMPWFINVTGNSLSSIGSEVCRMVGNRQPVGLVKNKRAQIVINKMFGGM